MRHRKSFNHLGRQRGHRKAMLANMASSLILHKRIKTTTAKAKALKIFVEPLITKSKDDSTHARRVVFSYLQDKNAVSELFREVSPKIGDRPGGYTRILKTGNRLGDNADMCIIELVDYNENLLSAKEETAAKSGRRRRRSGSKKKSEADAPEQDANAVIQDAEVVAEEKSEATEEIVEAKEEAKVEKTEEKAADEEAKVEAKIEEAKEDKKEGEEKADDTEAKKE